MANHARLYALVIAMPLIAAANLGAFVPAPKLAWNIAAHLEATVLVAMVWLSLLRPMDELSYLAYTECVVIK